MNIVNNKVLCFKMSNWLYKDTNSYLSSANLPNVIEMDTKSLTDVFI